MNGLSILFLLIILLIVFIFTLGIIMVIIGLLRTDKKNTILKAGLFFITIPPGLIAVLYLVGFIQERLAFKPTKNDLVGIYHITDAGRLIDTDEYHSYILELKENGTFYMSSTPNIEVCETGRYSLDWEFESNELSFNCENINSTAHIDRSWTSFRIEFIINDPDSGESIFFSKEN